MNLPTYRFTEHACFEIARRGLSREQVQRVLDRPEQTLPSLFGRTVLQSRLPFPPDGKIYLVRVILDMRQDPPNVITAYKTSKIEKYWRKS
jgi:hypothetical protein